MLAFSVAGWFLERTKWILAALRQCLGQSGNVVHHCSRQLNRSGHRAAEQDDGHIDESDDQPLVYKQTSMFSTSDKELLIKKLAVPSDFNSSDEEPFVLKQVPGLADDSADPSFCRQKNQQHQYMTQNMLAGVRKFNTNNDVERPDTRMTCYGHKL